MDLPLSSLLYYDLSTIKNGDLKKGLKEYRLLLTAFIEAIEAFEGNHLEKFDSLVGENACQIRAIRIALIHAMGSIDLELKHKANEVRNKLNHLLSTKIKSIISGKLNFKELLQFHNLELLVNKDTLFLFKSFILCEAKETIESEFNPSLSAKLKCAPHKLSKFCSEISLNFARKQTNFLRQLLSQSSVKFVQETALKLQDACLVEALSDDLVYDHNSLSCLPMFWTYKALLKLAKNSNIPLIVRVKSLKEENNLQIVAKETAYFFKPIQDFKGNYHYEITTPNEEDLTKAACIIEGVADYSDFEDLTLNFFKNSIFNVILAGAADHRQYPSPNPSFKPKNLEYLYFKSMALSQGFSLENPSSFFIHHVYTMQVKRVFPSKEQMRPLSFPNYFVGASA